MSKWERAQTVERLWHGDCANSYEEETKQIFYMRHSGIKLIKWNGKYPVVDFKGQTVLDIGGGAYSPLLKGINLYGTVLDPCKYPAWVYLRYEAAGIKVIYEKAEDYCKGEYDIGLIFNVLQHVEDPKKIIQNAKTMCSKLYVFEWIEVPTNEAHINMLHADELRQWLGGEGKTGVEQNTQFFAGVFE